MDENKETNFGGRLAALLRRSSATASIESARGSLLII